MKLYLNTEEYIDTDKGVDLSIPISSHSDSVNAWYVDPVKIEPVKSGSFVGDVNQGGTVNFKDVTINPHGNGTHTECVGHISKELFTINQCLKSFHHKAQVISVSPKKIQNEVFNQIDQVITKDCISNGLSDWSDEKILIVRTLPNEIEKKNKQYSGSNPPYFTKEAISLINEIGVEHLMVDLPSVDREVDHGALTAHKTFWSYPENPQLHKTISELLFIPNELKDGKYIIQIQIISLENDASPSKIVAHEILK